MDLAKNVHALTASFPREELYGLTSQIRRAAVSIPSNIAEGSQRTSNKEFANFILIAKGSLAELQTQLLLAVDFHYVGEEKFHPIADEMEELDKMLHVFHSKLVT